MAICSCLARNLVRVKVYIILYSRGSQPVVRVPLMVCGNTSFFEKDELKNIRWYPKTLFDHLVIRGWEKVGNLCSFLFYILGRLFNSLIIWLCFYKLHYSTYVTHHNNKTISWANIGQVFFTIFFVFLFLACLNVFQDTQLLNLIWNFFSKWPLLRL